MYGGQMFTAVGPLTWNLRPKRLCNFSPSTSVFDCLLKIFLFLRVLVYSALEALMTMHYINLRCTLHYIHHAIFSTVFSRRTAIGGWHWTIPCLLYRSVPSMLWCCWLGGRKGIQPVKNWVFGCWQGICLERGADLHIAQLMPLPLTISCSSKSRLVLPQWFCFCGAGLPRVSWKKAVKRM